jgi:hypothetical protein
LRTERTRSRRPPEMRATGRVKPGRWHA